MQKIHEFSLKLSKDFVINDNNFSDYYNDKERKCYQEFGYRFIRNLYTPHFTLGRLSKINEESKEFIKNYSEEFLLKQGRRTFKIKSICYHELGDNGSCRKVIFEERV